MFEARLPRLEDPAISREIGMLLGNDLGQMRIQFNAKTYVVEPVYRDDGLGLWDFGEDAPSMRRGARSGGRCGACRATGGSGPDLDPAGCAGGRQQGRPRAPGRTGPARHRDRKISRMGSGARHRAAGVDHGTRGRRAVAAIRASSRRRSIAPTSCATGFDGWSAASGSAGPIRLKRQLDGHDLDVDAMLEAGIALRMRQEPDPRIFRTTTSKHRDLAVLLLLDISESTRDRLASGASILDVERLAVAVLAEAMSALGDPFSMLRLCLERTRRRRNDDGQGLQRTL